MDLASPAASQAAVYANGLRHIHTLQTTVQIERASNSNSAIDAPNYGAGLQHTATNRHAGDKHAVLYICLHLTGKPYLQVLSLYELPGQKQCTDFACVCSSRPDMPHLWVVIAQSVQ